MEAVVELALEGPFELGVIEVARVQVKVVRVHRHRRVLELNDDLYPIALVARSEVEQGMLIQAKLIEDALQAAVHDALTVTIVNRGQFFDQASGGILCYNKTYRNTVRHAGGRIVETTYTSLRENLSSFLDKVANDQEVVIVRRRRSRDIALIPADELGGLLETAHLLRSPKNAQRLLTALRRATRKKGKPETLNSLRRELGLDPRR